MRHRSRVTTMVSGLVVTLLSVLLLQSLVSPASAQTALLGVIAGLVAMLVLQPLNSPSTQIVDYKLVPAGSLDQPTLDQFGKEGWRLICADQAGAGYIFAR